jgi:hypothetical protein
MEQRPSWQADSRSSGQNVAHPLCNLSVRDCVEQDISELLFLLNKLKKIISFQ